MDLSTAIRIFLKTSIKNKSPAFNFDWLTINWFSKEFEKSILKETKNVKNNWKTFSSTEDLFDDVLWDNWK